MAKDKQFVFSARTTADGLGILNRVRAERGVGWDALIIDAVNAHYGVEVPMPARKGPTPEERAAIKAAREAEKAAKAAEAKKKAEAKKAKAETGE